MVEVPDLRQNGAVLAAAKVGGGAGLNLERSLQLGQGVGGRVRGHNAGSGVHDVSQYLVKQRDRQMGRTQQAYRKSGTS